MSQTRCFHCGDPVPLGTESPYQQTIGDQSVYFCCPACQAITQTILGGGLGDYYQRRDQQSELPNRYDFTIWDDPKLQTTFVEEHGDYHQARLYIEGLHCTACAWLIEKHLGKITGIKEARVNYQQHALTVDWDQSISLSDIMTAVADIGYTPHPYQRDTVKELQQAESKKLLKRIGITGILMMQIGMFSIGLYAGDFLGISAEHHKLLSLFSLLFSLPLLYFSVLPFLTSAIQKLKNRQLSMDVSISLAIVGLYSSSVYSVISNTGDIYFDSIAMLCLFILLARYLEQKSRIALTPPSALLPAIATRLHNNEQQGVPLNEILSGDHILVREGEIIPLDGHVISGQSSVSEAVINGEGRPVSKTQGDQVFAGSQNHDGQMVIEVTHNSDNSLVKKIEQLSSQAAEDKPQLISITDAIAGYFTLIILILSCSTFAVWYALDNPQAFWIALSVLVVSCPCALSLAAPTALSAVQFRLRQQGILIQASQVIENLNQIQRIIFDKTGTLTEGQYSVELVCTVSTLDETDCLQLASALEQHSRHPIAHAFQVKGKHAENIHIVPNQGLQGEIDGKSLRIGTPGFCQQWHPQATEPDNQHQWIGLCNEQAFLAWFAINDQLRSDALPLIQRLRKRKLKLQILSGDASGHVQEIASQLGITDYQTGLSSAGKLQQLENLEQHDEHVLMLGDGVNDAPILAKSHVSATLLNACDWVKNSADMVLLNNQLLSIDEALSSARQYRKILRQNFGWAFLYNGLAIPFAMAGYITPYMAAIGMSLSSIIVVINSRRLSTAPARTD